MKRLIIIGLLAIGFLGFQNQVTAQVSFSHSVGGAAYFSKNVATPAIMYSPRLNLMELDNELTLSIGTHLGAWLAFNSREGASSATFDFPLMVELNFGHGADPYTRSDFGGFAGVGFGVSFMGADGGWGADINNAIGPVVNGGIRAYVFDQSLGLRLSYLYNLKSGDDTGSVFGVGIFYTFGDY